MYGCPIEHIGCSKEHIDESEEIRGAEVVSGGAGISFLSYSGAYQAPALERIEMIRNGIPAAEAKCIIETLGLSQGTALQALKLSPATVNKKAKQDHTLSPAESERVIGIARLVGQLETMIQESGMRRGCGATTPQWMSRWLQEPLPSLGGRRPLDLMDTMEGQGLVSAALSQVQSGAYA